MTYIFTKALAPSTGSFTSGENMQKAFQWIPLLLQMNNLIKEKINYRCFINNVYLYNEL